MAQIKIGMLGTSWWADSMYMPALTRHPNARVCAAVGRDLDHTRKFAEQWNIPNAYASLEDLLSNESVEAVVIATPNKYHHALAMTAIKHGVHVLCEKPLAMNYTEANHMAKCAEKARLKTMVAFTY